MKVYHIIVSRSDNDLMYRVNRALADGWELVGGVSATRAAVHGGEYFAEYFAQAVVKEGDRDKMERP